MFAKKTADQWFAEYGERHQHPAHQRISGICAPLIFATLLGFVWIIPVPESWLERAEWFNWTLVAMAAAVVFYVRLSPAIGAGMFLFMAGCYSVIVWIDLFAPWSVGGISAVAFVVAWMGLMIGRLVERSIPSFSQDLIFILIGPAWLLSLVYKRIGQKY